MTCNYFEYRKMIDKIYENRTLTDEYLNDITEQIRRYLVKGGAGDIIVKLGIGIKVTTKRTLLLPEEIIYKRFVWIDGVRKGEELNKSEIESIGMFLKQGAFYGKY